MEKHYINAVHLAMEATDPTLLSYLYRLTLSLLLYPLDHTCASELEGVTSSPSLCGRGLSCLRFTFQDASPHYLKAIPLSKTQYFIHRSFKNRAHTRLQGDGKQNRKPMWVTPAGSSMMHIRLIPGHAEPALRGPWLPHKERVVVVHCG